MMFTDWLKFDRTYEHFVTISFKKDFINKLYYFNVKGHLCCVGQLKHISKCKYIVFRLNLEKKNIF